MKVLKFGAIWCAECLTMRPMWEEIEQEIPELKTEYYDADDHQELLDRYEIKKIPTFIFFDDNDEEILRLQGLQNKNELIEIIQEHLDK